MHFCKTAYVLHQDFHHCSHLILMILLSDYPVWSLHWLLHYHCVPLHDLSPILLSEFPADMHMLIHIRTVFHQLKANQSCYCNFQQERGVATMYVCEGSDHVRAVIMP